MSLIRLYLNPFFLHFLKVRSFASPHPLLSSPLSHDSHQPGRVKSNTFSQRHVKSSTAFFFQTAAHFAFRGIWTRSEESTDCSHTRSHRNPEYVYGAVIDRGARVILSLTLRKRCRFCFCDSEALVTTLASSGFKLATSFSSFPNFSCFRLPCAVLLFCMQCDTTSVIKGSSCSEEHIDHTFIPWVFYKTTSKAEGCFALCTCTVHNAANVAALRTRIRSWHWRDHFPFRIQCTEK